MDRAAKERRIGLSVAVRPPDRIPVGGVRSTRDDERPCLGTSRAGNVQRHHRGQQYQICRSKAACRNEPASRLGGKILSEATSERASARLSCAVGAPIQTCGTRNGAGGVGMSLAGMESAGCEQAHLSGLQQGQWDFPAILTSTQAGLVIKPAHPAPGRVRTIVMRMTKTVFM
jgi:hypothetical protein